MIGPLLFVALVAAVAISRSPAGPSPRDRWTWGLAFVAFVGGLVALPPGGYVPGGHEGLYLALAGGASIDPASEGPFATLPVGVAVAQALGVVGGRPGELAWLVLNRLAVPVCILAAASIPGVAAGPDAGRRGGRIAAALVFAATPLHAHAATGFWVAPASAFALLALAFGVRGRRPEALLWAALAAGSRLETLPLALAGVLLSRLRAPDRRRPLDAALAWITAAGVAAVLVQRGAPPVEAGLDRVDVVLAGLASLPLAGPAATPGVVVLGGLLVLSALFTERRRLDPHRRLAPRLLLLLLGTAAVTAAPVLTVIDLGARHWLPTLGATAAALGTAAAAAGGSPAGRVLGGATAGLAVLLFAAQAGPLHTRHAAGDAAPLPSWERVDPNLPERPAIACRLLSEDAGGGPGVGPFSGAEVLAARRARQAGPHPCVLLDAPDAHVIRGDARADRLDRARLLLGLRPTLLGERLVWFAPAGS